MNRVEITEAFLQSCERERHRMGITQAEMARELGMTSDAYKKLVSGTVAKIDLYTAIRLSEISGLSIRELCGYTELAPRLISRMLLLTERQKRFIQDIVDFEICMRSGHHDDPDRLPCLIPIGNVEDGMIWDSCSWGHVEVGDYLRRFPELSCAIRITSNHLHPVYVEGDVLLIARRPPRDGDVGVFVNTQSGSAYIREYKQGEPCRLNPINGYGRPFCVNPHDPEDMAQWLKFGVVITKLR